MENDITIHKYQKVKLVRLGYSMFHSEQASKHLMLNNISFDKSGYNEYIVKTKPLISSSFTVLSYR